MPRPDIGVLRSDDYGKTWRSIAKGLPSDFGFPLAIDPARAPAVQAVAAAGGVPLAFVGRFTGSPDSRTIRDAAGKTWALPDRGYDPFGPPGG